MTLQAFSETISTGENFGETPPVTRPGADAFKKLVKEAIQESEKAGLTKKEIIIATRKTYSKLKGMKLKPTAISTPTIVELKRIRQMMKPRTGVVETVISPGEQATKALKAAPIEKAIHTLEQTRGGAQVTTESFRQAQKKLVEFLTSPTGEQLSAVKKTELKQLLAVRLPSATVKLPAIVAKMKPISTETITSVAKTAATESLKREGIKITSKVLASKIARFIPYIRYLFYAGLAADSFLAYYLKRLSSDNHSEHIPQGEYYHPAIGWYS